jgi:TldD protein
LLSVWDHPELGRWIGDLTEPAPARTWSPPSGTRAPVIFTSGTAGVLLHELVGHHVEADVVLSGGSPLATLLGASITTPALDLVDDPSRFDLPGGFSRDDEGMAADPVLVVGAGRLLAWLCDRTGSERLGGSGGRGRRASCFHPPASRLSNLVVAPGDTPPRDLENELRQGLLVDSLGGASVDPVSNRLLLRVERGWEIHQGRRRRALAPFELTGSSIDVLAHIEPTIANDPRPDWRLGWCVKDGAGLATGSEAPTMMVHRLEVL